MNLLECKVHTALVSEDGISFDLFGGDNYKTFIERIVLQMMDVIYAQIQPSWWGLDNAVIPDVLGKLIPSRDAIGALIPLIETVSRCTMEKLQCQSWRQVDGRSESFVSALDPQVTSHFF
jgi:hypothetical protein